MDTVSEERAHRAVCNSDRRHRRGKFKHSSLLLEQRERERERSEWMIRAHANDLLIIRRGPVDSVD